MQDAVSFRSEDQPSPRPFDHKSKQPGASKNGTLVRLVHRTRRGVFAQPTFRITEPPLEEAREKSYNAEQIIQFDRYLVNYIYFLYRRIEGV